MVERPVKAEVHCVVHGDMMASIMCERCGDFACSDCVKQLFGRQVCQGCVERYEGEALGDFKQRLWGKRDAYVWFFGGLGSFFCGFFGLLGPLALILVLNNPGPMTAEDFQMLVMGGLLVICFGATLPYFLLQKWARKALFIVPIAVMGLTVTSVYAEFSADSASFVSLFCIGIVPLSLVFFAYLSPRNELAFRIDVEDEVVQSLFERSAGNPEARHSLWITFLGFFIPPLLLVSLVLALMGYFNCNSEAWPPIGGKRRATISFVLSLLGLSGWLWLIVQGFTS